MGRPRIEKKPQCRESDCPRDAWARGLCSKHYQQLRKRPDFQPIRQSDLVERFWRNVDTSAGPDACWPWTGAVHPSGYGSIYVRGSKTRLHKVHRFSFELANGPIPDGMEVDHTCHTKDCPTPGWGDAHRKCCNPAHLEGVDHTRNVRRSQAPEKTVEYYKRYRAEVTHCPQGHPFEDNTQWRRTKEGYLARRCAECNRISTREWKRKRAQVRHLN